MRQRITVTLLFAALIGSVGFATALSTESKKSVRSAPNEVSNKAQRRPDDAPGTINGAETPELIPNHAAYLLLFRFLSDRQTEAEKNKVRNYLRQAGLGCQSCSARQLHDPSRLPGEADVEALISVAEEFQTQIGPLDRQVAEIKDMHWPNPGADVMAQLTQLQKQKEAIVATLVASLPYRLSHEGVEKLSYHINERVKRGMKIFPSRTALPSLTSHHLPSHSQ